jgi:hypothetical protein
MKALTLTILVALCCALFLLLLALPAWAVPDWHFEATATSTCNAAGTGADVAWSFRNTDSRAMRVTVRWHSVDQVFVVAAGSTIAGTFNDNPLPFASGYIRFLMAWIGAPGTDSATRNYSAVDGCVPTAVTLARFAVKGCIVKVPFMAPFGSFVTDLRVCRLLRRPIIDLRPARHGKAPGLATSKRYPPPGLRCAAGQRLSFRWMADGTLTPGRGVWVWGCTPPHYSAW